MINLELWKKRKKELRLTNIQVSQKSGVPIRTVEDIFRGSTSNPRIDTVQAIERALGLSADPPTDKTAEPLTEAEERLLGAYRQLVPSMQDYILEMVEKLIESQPTAVKSAKRA